MGVIFLRAKYLGLLEKVILLQCVEVEEDDTRTLRLFSRKPKPELVTEYSWTKYRGDGRWYPRAALQLR